MSKYNKYFRDLEDKCFQELKRHINEMAEQYGWKVRYYTGDLGQPLRVISPTGKSVRALKVEKGSNEIIVFADEKGFYAYYNGARWDITPNITFFQLREEAIMKRAMRRKIAQDKPSTGGMLMVMHACIKAGLNIDELIDIFICNPGEQKESELKTIQM